MGSIIKDLDVAVALFRTHPKTNENLEYLVHFLGQFDAIRTHLQYSNMQHQYKIADSFQLENFCAGQIIFHKGHSSSHYYFVLGGTIEAFNEERDGTRVLVGLIGVGRSLGDIGILTHQSRSLTCIAKTDGFFLVLSAKAFMDLLSPTMLKSLEQKIKFIDHYFPNLKNLTSVHKQRIAYAMGSYTASRGQSISVIGETLPHICFISEGELVVTLVKPGSTRKMLLKLAPGNLIGEESVLFNKPLKYDIKVSSEYTQFYTLSKASIKYVLSHETTDIWKQNFRAKDRSRHDLIENLSLVPITKRQTSTNSNFKLASEYASKRLDTIQKRNDQHSNSSHFGKKNLLVWKSLKEFSPAAILSQGKILISKRSKFVKLNGYASKQNFSLQNFSLNY